MVLILLENFCLQIQCIAVGRWGPSCASLLIYKQAVIRIIKMRRKSLGKLVKRMIYVASLPWVPSLTYLPCSFLLEFKSFERVFPSWHMELSSISLVPATHAVGSIVQYLCFRGKKIKLKKKGIIFLLSLCVLLQSSEQLCVPALTNEKGCLSGKRSLCRHSNTFLIYWFLPLQSGHRLAFFADPIRFAQPFFMALDLTCPKALVS